jgi:hypothetical protein
VTETVKMSERGDLPGWDWRFHASRVAFRFWKPGGGYVMLGKNEISEYRNLSLFEAEVGREIERMDPAHQSDAVRYFALLRQMQRTEEVDAFQELLLRGDNLSTFAELLAWAKEAPEETYFFQYYQTARELVFDREGYHLLRPPVKVGDSMDEQEGMLFCTADPPFDPAAGIHTACVIERRTVQSYERGVKVSEVHIGLIRQDEMVANPRITIEAPVSLNEKIYELADAMDNNIGELRTERDLLRLRVYVHNFINYMGIIDRQSRLKPGLDFKQKEEWLNQNHFIYSLINNKPENAFGNLVNTLNRYKQTLPGNLQIDDYKDAFFAAWGQCLARLKAIGICEKEIEPGKTVVTPSDLLEGWKKENTEQRIADSEHPADTVYGIIKKGIEIDGTLIQKPIVNVYSY